MHRTSVFFRAKQIDNQRRVFKVSHRCCKESNTHNICLELFKGALKVEYGKGSWYVLSLFNYWSIQRHEYLLAFFAMSSFYSICLWLQVSLNQQKGSIFVFINFFNDISCDLIRTIQHTIFISSYVIKRISNLFCFCYNNNLQTYIFLI